MNSIKKNKEFRFIYNKGKSIADSRLVLHKVSRSQTSARLGISISSKVGNAVVRNKIKRRIKEIIRINEEDILNTDDIVFVVRVRCKDADFYQIQESVWYLLKKFKLLKDPSKKWK